MQVSGYGISLPPLTRVTVALPVFRSDEVIVWDVGLPLSVLQVLVTIFLSGVTRVLWSSFIVASSFRVDLTP